MSKFLKISAIFGGLLLGCLSACQSQEQAASGVVNATEKSVSKTTSSSIGVHQINVHTAQELWQRGCDIWNAGSDSCQAASMQYCIAHGYAGGFGPVEYIDNVATVECLDSNVATYESFPYAGACTADSPTSLACQSEARRSCVALGFSGAVGVTEANDGVIGTMCLNEKSGVEGVTITSVSELQAGIFPNCTTDGIVNGDGGCQTAVHRFCEREGFGTGFNVSEFNANTGEGLALCAPANAGPSAIDLSTGVARRAAVLGTMLMGGPTAGGRDNSADTVYNNFSFPILVTLAQPYAFQGFTLSSTAGDSCFYLNQGLIYQVDNSIDGELMCIHHPSSTTYPGLPYGDSQRGILLQPGQSLLYQGDSGGTAGYYDVTNVTFSMESNLVPLIPMMRVRFPRWDTGWNGSVSPLTVSAGCDVASCPILATSSVTVPPGKPALPSNSWYVVPAATAIRGITVFGSTQMSFTIRIVQQGGAQLLDPITIDLSTVADFVSGTSAFIPLDLDIPAGALVGIDYTLPVNPVGGPTDDFAGYLWFDQRPM
jgi:hypothetical protein